MLSNTHIIIRILIIILASWQKSEASVFALITIKMFHGPCMPLYFCSISFDL